MPCYILVLLARSFLTISETKSGMGRPACLVKPVCLSKIPGRYLAHQESLPKLPVPPLKQTCDHYLAALEPIVTPEELQHTQRLVEEFQLPGGLGDRLQSSLERRAKKLENWLSDWWLQTAYLDYRMPVVVHSSPGVVLPRLQFSDWQGQIRYAAKLIAGVLDFKTMIDNETLPVEYLGGNPLCMNQYYQVLSSCRIPGIKKDSVVNHALSNRPPTYITVVHNFQFFVLDVYNRDGTPLTVDQLYNQLEKICTSSLETKNEPIGILTSNHRDSWGKAYANLIKDRTNNESVKAIQKSIFTVCLDAPMPKVSDEMYHTRAAVQMLHGGGSRWNSGNRWFDKTLQFIIGEDGTCGVIYEHAPAEGPPIVALIDHVVEYTKKSEMICTPTVPLPMPRKLHFNITPEIKRDIEEAKQNINLMVNDLDVRVIVFTHFGKNIPKSYKMSPDAFIQVALQLAYYRLYKHCCATYESASLRMFRLGRTDTIRSASIAAANFVRAMDNPVQQNPEKVTLLKKAVKAHRAYTDMAIRGQAIDRHLLGLRLQAVEDMSALPKIFTDKSYAIANHYNLSTSQVPAKTDCVMCFGPVVPDGYGVCYNPMEKHINFAVSAFNSCADTNATQLAHGLQDALVDIKSLLDQTLKSKLAKLASLFGLFQAEPEGNESFKFTAPKQPKKLPSGLGSPSQKQVPPPTTPALLLAVAVHAFHFVNGQYMKHGKLGAAILGNYVNKEYKILLYGSQQKQIASARIHNGFILTIQPGNYAAFYDDRQQSWSLKFDSEDARIDFFKKVCVARWNSQTCRDTLLTQDLVHGEGPTISMGDTVEVALSSCLLQNHAMEQLFDSKFCKDKLQRVSLHSDTPLMGWEKGMLGMQKGGRRLIIVSPSMGYESNGGPSCATHFSTLFAVEVLQVNGSKEADSSAAGSTDSNKSLVSALALCCSNQGDQEPWAKCRTPNKLPKLPEADKVKVIARMAKVGQPTVRFLKVAAPHTDYAIEVWGNVWTHMESSVCVSVCGLSAQAAASSPLPVETASSSSSTAVHLPEAVNTRTVKEVHVCSDRAFQPHSSHLQPFTLTFPPQHTPYPSDVGSYMISESRQHNTEIRLAVAKVIDKVDCLASKMDELQKQGKSSFALSGGSLETAMIMHNIQRIIHENTSLKKDVLERGTGVKEQDYKIGALTEQRCMEKSNLLLEQTNDVLQSSGHHSRLLKAEEEKMRLVKELDLSSSCVCKLQQKVDSLQQRVTELQTELSAILQESQSRCALISCLESNVEELKREIVQSRQQWREEKQKCRKMKWTMTNTEEEIQDLKEENKSLNQLLSDKKRRWQQERERFLLEQEEQRSSSEQEQQQLLDQLRKARSIAGTYSGPQVELEWKERCDVALKEQKLKLEVITQLQIKNSNLQKELAREKRQINAQLAEQVKLVMNGLFRSLRAEFNLQETYPGESVLTIVLNTIKQVTRQFLKELKSEEDDEKYVTAEEKTRGRIEEHGKKSEKMESPQSLDHTYTTAYETNSLEASEVSSDSFREATGEVKGLKKSFTLQTD